MLSWNDLMGDKSLLWDFFGNIHDLKGSQEHIYIYRRMQYTGLKDKNGKEIYEGDYIRKDEGNPISIVEWNDRSAGFGLFCPPSQTGQIVTGLYTRMITGDESGEWEIIGNVWEHPDLATRSPQGAGTVLVDRAGEKGDSH